MCCITILVCHHKTLWTLSAIYTESNDDGDEDEDDDDDDHHHHHRYHHHYTVLHYVTPYTCMYTVCCHVSSFALIRGMNSFAVEGFGLKKWHGWWTVKNWVDSWITKMIGFMDQ